MDSNLKREIMLENYQNPINKGLTEANGYYKINSRNSSCVDNLDIMVKFDNDIIIDMRFDGEACAVSTSATSIMIKTLTGKTKEEAKEIILNYKSMINEEEYNASLLGELNVYDEIYKQPSRKKCATLPMEAVEKILDSLKNN